MTVLKLSREKSSPLNPSSRPVPDDESVQALLEAIRYDLLLDRSKTEKQIKKRMSDLASTLNHIAKSLKMPREQLTIGDVAKNEDTFVSYFSAAGISHAKQSANRSIRNTILRYARKCGFSPTSFALLDEWESVLAVLPRSRGVSGIARDAIRRNRRLIDFSRADLSLWAQAKLDAGRTYDHVMSAQSRFLTAIRNSVEIQRMLPRLDLAAGKNSECKIPIMDMPQSVRNEITEMLDLKRARVNLGLAKMTPTTEREIIGHFESFIGYAIRVCGMDLTSLDLIVKEPFVREFAFWLHKERRCKRATVVGRLSRMFAALENSPLFKDRDLSWIRNIYRKLRPEPASALKQRRRERHVEFQDLAAIPGRMCNERKALVGLSEKDFGWLIHDELAISASILAQWPPSFLRLAELGKNVFKGPIPKDGTPFSIPSWAKRALDKDPNTKFWQFRSERSTGELHRGLVLRAIVPLLELYIRKYRRLVVYPRRRHLFCNRSGDVLTCSTLGNLITSRLRRYFKKRVSMTSIRSSFAYYFRANHPNSDAVLSQIQWVNYATTKMRYDEEFQKQRALRAHRRKNRDQ